MEGMDCRCKNTILDQFGIFLLHLVVSQPGGLPTIHYIMNALLYFYFCIKISLTCFLGTTDGPRSSRFSAMRFWIYDLQPENEFHDSLGLPQRSRQATCFLFTHRI